MAVTPADSPAKKDARETLYEEITRQVKMLQTDVRPDDARQAAIVKDLAEAYAHVADAAANKAARAMST